VTDVRSLVLRDLALVNLVPLAIAFAVAELFYKFHSFTLEAAAFVATWYVLRLATRALTVVR
jgi:hypothetical protein